MKQVSCAGTGALSCAGRTQTARGAPPAAPSTPPPRSTSPAASTPRLRHAKARRVRQRLPRVGIKNAGLVRFPTRQRPIGQRRRGWRRTQAARVHVHAHVGDVRGRQRLVRRRHAHVRCAHDAVQQPAVLVQRHQAREAVLAALVDAPAHAARLLPVRGARSGWVSVR